MKPLNKLFLIEEKNDMRIKIDMKNTGICRKVGVGGKEIQVIECLFECTIAFSK